MSMLPLLRRPWIDRATDPIEEHLIVTSVSLLFLFAYTGFDFYTIRLEIHNTPLEAASGQRNIHSPS
jgi:hypothetical protein